MTNPKKDEVSTDPAQHTDTGSTSSPPSSGGAANTATHPTGDPQTSPAGEAASSENGVEQDATPDNVQELLLEAAQAEAKDWQDKYVRLHAEWDTYRRRTAEQRQQEKARAAEKLVESLLPVIDDFERTIDYAQKNSETGLLGGVEAVHAKLIDVLTKDGVIILNPVGEAFDALEAQAVATVDDSSVPDETVSEVYQKGYKMGDKVLRPAMVTVSTGGPKREIPVEESDEKK